MGNYAQYLQRMTDSAIQTTKQLIPVYAASTMRTIEKPRILEVGIGSGIIGKLLRDAIPNAYLVGIDINASNIKEAIETEIYDECLTQDFMTYESSPFDLIIFSSVVHEICAYDTRFEYDAESTLDAVFKHSACLLHKNGYVILRDGLAEDIELRNDDETYYMEDTKSVELLIRFMDEFRCFVQEEFEMRTVSIQIHRQESGRMYFEITCPRWLMREFLCTATWGLESWEREIKERFCFSDNDTIQYFLNKYDFKVEHALFTSEQYNEYFKKLIKFPNEQDLIGLYVAKKL